MVDHTKFKQLISAYYDNELSQEEIKTTEDHLIDCAECQSYYKDIQKLSSTLRHWNDEDVSNDLAHEVQRSLLAEKIKESKPMDVSKSVFKVTASVFMVLFAITIFYSQYMKKGIKGRLKVASYDMKDANENISESTTIRGRKQDAQKPVTQPARVVSQLASVNKELRNVSLKSGLVKSKSSSEIIAKDSVMDGRYDYDKSIKRGFVGGMQQIASLEEVDTFMRRPMPYPVEPRDGFSTEDYNRIYENAFLDVTENPLSTFSIDVDTASYSNVRRFLNSNQMPPQDAVRIEEMLNYFSYDYPEPEGDDPFSITTDVAIAPWNEEHHLLRVGLKGKMFDQNSIPKSNLVFLLDVSGSMNNPNKLPLLKSAFKMMVNQLSENERVAIVVYAGAAGTVLKSTPGDNKQSILDALSRLQAGGSTAGGAGIKLAYKIAQDNFINNGNNRVILATDGDFNIGVSSDSELIRMIEKKREDGVFLTVLGFGTGNYKDNKMEQLANKGNGNFYYIDTNKEAKKVLVKELGSALFSIAKDVKIQIEFNPSHVKAYRLIGCENRLLAKEDFNDDTKDAGELGAGHTVTALYEIVPVGIDVVLQKVDDLKYQKSNIIESEEMLTVKLRYKKPDAKKSQLIKQVVSSYHIQEHLQGDFQFASSVASFGMLLRDSAFKGSIDYAKVIKSAQASKGKDSFGYRQEFIDLVKKAETLDTRSDATGINFKNQ